eukprot:12100423-Prorocentrum_lima.AAC.1
MRLASFRVDQRSFGDTLWTAGKPAGPHALTQWLISTRLASFRVDQRSFGDALRTPGKPVSHTP